MAKTGRNDPCPCGSGKKYKKCCEANAMADAAQRARAMADAAQRQARSTAVEPSEANAQQFIPAWDDDLDEISNSVIDLIKEKRFDEALVACERLRTEFPGVIDWLERSAMVHEARGDLALAVDFYRRALAFTQQPDQRDGFDEDGRDYYRRKIGELQSRLPPSVAG